MKTHGFGVLGGFQLWRRPVAFAACLEAFGRLLQQAEAQAPKIFFDANLSSDHHDAAGIAMVRALMDLRECELSATGWNDEVASH